MNELKKMNHISNADSNSLSFALNLFHRFFKNWFAKTFNEYSLIVKNVYNTKKSNKIKKNCMRFQPTNRNKVTEYVFILFQVCLRKKEKLRYYNTVQTCIVAIRGRYQVSPATAVFPLLRNEWYINTICPFEHPCFFTKLKQVFFLYLKRCTAINVFVASVVCLMSAFSGSPPFGL